MDEAANKVTITITGPDTVWFGGGFNADAMAAMPWTIVVDGHGTVSSHDLPLCISLWHGLRDDSRTSRSLWKGSEMTSCRGR